MVEVTLILHASEGGMKGTGKRRWPALTISTGPQHFSVPHPHTIVKRSLKDGIVPRGMSSACQLLLFISVPPPPCSVISSALSLRPFALPPPSAKLRSPSVVRLAAAPPAPAPVDSPLPQTAASGRPAVRPHSEPASGRGRRTSSPATAPPRRKKARARKQANTHARKQRRRNPTMIKSRKKGRDR